MSGSLWKREISLGRRRNEADDVRAEEAAVAAEPARTAEELIAADSPDPAPTLPPPTGEYGWLTEDFKAAEFRPAANPAQVAAASAPPVSVPQSARLAAAPPAAGLVQVPAVEAPAPAELALVEKKPFWKQELKLTRTPKEKKAKPKPAKPPKPDATSEKLTKPPFWKRELSLGKSKAPKAPAPADETTAKSSKRPFWKRELSLGKSKTSEQAQVRSDVSEKVARPPFWKRELSVGRTKTAGAPKEPRAAKPKGGREPKPATGGNLVGLKIGASQIVAARVANGAEPQLLQVARLPLDDGVVAGGELRDIETLGEKLKELFKANKLPKKAVRLGIANSRVGVRTFEISGIEDPQQLANAIRFRAQETLPIPLEDAVLDWQVLSETTDPETGQTTRQVMLVVAYRELVDRYLAACRKAGIRVVGIDLEAFAVLRALDAPTPSDAPAPTGAQVVVNVGHDRSTFAVSNGRVCEFTRVMSWGGQSVSVAIARALDLSPSEASPIKHALSLVATSTELPDGMTREALDKARDAVLRELQAFARELVSSLRFYQNQPGSLGIGGLVLTGGTAHLPGLADELNRLIGVPVTVGDPLNRVALAKKFRAPDCTAGSLTVAIGLGIED